MTVSKRHTLIIAAAALTVLAFGHSSHAQTGALAATDKPPHSLQSEYQQELDKWMLQAYEGDPDAQFKVGVLFTNDQFHSADLEQSAYWYKQAARQGHSLAQYNLGHQYLTGSGVKRNETEAMKWWLKAAEQDHPLAQFNIGRAYYLGIGLKEDHSQSQLWFERAAQNNEPKSIGILTELNWSKPSDYKSTPKLAATDPQLASKTATPETTALNAPSNSTDKLAPIAVYTNPAKRSVLIAILDDRKHLNVVSSKAEWTEVTNHEGLPVWVHKNYIVVSNDIGTIKGNSVNARSVPLITNGTIVGRLNNNESVVVIDQQNAWYRVVSPSHFTAWVKTEDYNRSEPVEANALKAAEQVTSESLATNLDSESDVTISGTPKSSSPINDNDWLFNQPADGYTLQLASFNDPQKIAAFRAREKFINNPALHSFTSTPKETVWTYFLYGEFASSETAKQARIEINQNRAWIRSFGKLQQNRCISWKRQIPAPKELNRYCS